MLKTTKRKNGIKVEVTDLETNTTTTYHAIRAAARALDIDKRYIEHYIYLKQDKPVLGVKSTYHAIRAAARALNIDRRYIENYIYLKQE
ncbi:GIY-YIG endonuclease (mitochondrion) protein [Rutstroemia sp. NJR-2017a BBW]|nr:GIY-YIG endonuclease (mitochondrion) protein [Rutstroemia sp. NJR-2017a BBW]